MLRSRRILSAASTYVNGGSLLKREEKLFRTIPLNNPSQRTSARFIDANEISKAYKRLVPAASALKFPTLEVNLTDVSMLKLPVTCNENDTNASTSDTAKAFLVCLAFRDSEKPMVGSWIEPFLNAFPNSSDIRVQEVSFLHHWLLCFGPMKKRLIKIMREFHECIPERDYYALKWQKAWFIGDHSYFRKELKLINLSTGYVFLLDSFGRVRWQGTGFATGDELQSLLYCTSALLAEDELLFLLSRPSAPLEEKTAEVAA